MNKKRLFTGLLALLLVFALLGCEQVTSGTKSGSGPGTEASPDDTWTKVNLNEATGLDVFKGKWKSSAKTKQTVENVEYDVTMVLEMTYPASGPGAGGVAITDGVKVFMSMNGAPQGEARYMTLEEAIQGGDVYVNQSKTRIKLEQVTILESLMSDEEWKTYQEESVKETGELSGDQTVTYSTGAPYTETITIIFHKQQ